MKKSIFLVFILNVLLIAQAMQVSAARRGDGTKETGDVVLDPVPKNKNAIFKAGGDILYTLNIKNNTKGIQSGKISYLIASDEGQILKSDFIKLDLTGNDSKSLLIRVSPKVPGFYHINFMVNTPDYDDTVKKVFGVSPEMIKSQLHKPDDFNAFWKQTRTDLEKVKPDYKITERKDLSTKYKKVYLVEMRSYDNLLIRGWLVVPTDGKNFPVHYRTPGYLVSLKPNMDNDDFITFDLNVRGNGNSKDVIDVGTDHYCLVYIENKDKYIYRGIYMDCIRGVDFLYSHPGLGIDTSKIFVEGGSQGGELALVTSALDTRIKALTLQVPLYSDMHDAIAISASYEEQVIPFKAFRKYLSAHYGYTWDKFFGTFDYYDPQNFAPMVKCPVLMGIGLLDPVCPPRCSMALFNHISSTSKEFVCVPNTAHEVNFNYFIFQNLWLREKLRIP